MIKVTVFLVLALFATTEAVIDKKEHPLKLRETIRRWHDTCLVKAGTNEATIQGMDNGNFPEDPALKEYIVCVLKFSGMLTKEGTINTISVKDHEPPIWGGKLSSVVHKCHEKHKDVADINDRLFKCAKCVYDYNPALYFFP